MKLYIIDAFTQKPYSGNPAAVVLVDVFPSEDIMQLVAMEMNLSETTFVKKLSENNYHIRWFSPTHEVKLCGHATLAAAFVLKKEGCLSSSQIHFASLGGALRVDVSDEKITLDFPLEKVSPFTCDPSITAALGTISPVSVAKGENDDSFLIVQYASQGDIEKMQPNVSDLLKATTNAVIVTAPGERGDYVCRVFAPYYGINEDPVTGSAQVFLADFWSSILKKNHFHGLQLSKRGGEFWVTRQADRVEISGYAVGVATTVFSHNAVVK